MTARSIITIAVASQLLTGCFFVYIPSSVTSAVTDAFTGHEGVHCVGPNTEVGQKIRLPDGQIGTVQSLSGTSSRCKNPTTPIRAKIT